ncbi:transposase [Bacillus cereus group sp. BfR-BA-01331]|uniref:transposase n=1 Tax=Bacillus cereus group sp. BfR-BA-01331 TaxID=2920307 RepID=UPI001F58DAE6|nr:transposase [Bacillus cereus group sp. BfR-BA-01331]
MKEERRTIINEISYLEVKHCIECPLYTSKEVAPEKNQKKKTRNNKLCEGCPVYKEIRERGERLNKLSKQGTFNIIKQKYMDNPSMYLQYKEYPIEVIIAELGITKYELRKRMKQMMLQTKME